MQNECFNRGSVGRSRRAMKWPRFAARPAVGFTLIELMVVVAIVGLLVALLMPAIQAAREAARRGQCLNNLRQIATATFTFEASRRELPPGVDQSLFSAAPVYRGSSLFVYLLPHLEETTLLDSWDFDDPFNNTAGGNSALTAKPLAVLICPSDTIDENPVKQSNEYYALTSYGGNGGTRSYFPAVAKTDGVFHSTGPASEPVAKQRRVRIKEILDGTTHTLLLGERSHLDPNYESCADMLWAQSLRTWGWWGPSGGRKAVGHVTMSAAAPINWQVPITPATAASADPPASDGVSFAHYADLRVSAFGSNHPGGANFVMADGSGRFMSEVTSLELLQCLATRAGEELQQQK